ncbi:MAG TPA: PHB depolymerase family esterase [Polyangiaceae bacterium]|nr:PHB depolymerase family esterase [Polyangiaceae bacterium]
MQGRHLTAPALFATALGLLAPGRAHAASLQKVGDWGASGVPTTVSMYIYVPDKPAKKPPILVLSHYCGGTASAVFGQAQGLIKAADQYGFIVVVPQTSKNCWDVGSTKSLTHDGGGDTQAIAQMVKYTLSKYQADANRVYATGDSSGGMMTQALLAVYPDVFKAGSAFAGVPAGCWAAGDPDGSWSSQCAGGQVTHTPKEWGDLARGMDTGYSGHRPRVQLFHGDADTTINFKNHTEAIKQWTNVLGLNADPTSTDTVTLGTHQATRQRWQNACGYVVLDAFTSKGGDHGPSDAIFNASYVVPFLGLDQTTGVDPEVEKCGAGGSSGAGGTASVGGSGGSGGASAVGGALGSGGNLAAGGTTSSSAGAATVAGGPSSGGALSAAGSPAASGSAAAGAGGSAPTAPTTGGGAAAAFAGSSATPAEVGGCSCGVAGGKNSPSAWFTYALGTALLLRIRRRRAGVVGSWPR